MKLLLIGNERDGNILISPPFSLYPKLLSALLPLEVFFGDVGKMVSKEEEGQRGEQRGVCLFCLLLSIFSCNQGRT